MSNSSPAVRAGTPDRAAAAAQLLAHHRLGQLTRDELDSRLALALAARTDEDLRLLVVDLPDLPPSAAPVPAATAPTARPTATVTFHPSGGRPATPLRIAFDVCVLFLTVAAFVCLMLLFAVGLVSSSDFAFPMFLAAFGAFTVGAGGVYLLHRMLAS